MLEKDKDNIVNRLKQIADNVMEVTNAVIALEEPMALVEKLSRITVKLGLRETAYKLDVDVRTVRRWLKGRRPLKKNIRKIESIYKDLSD